MPKKKTPKFNPKFTLVIIITLVIGFFGGTTYQSYQESQTEKLPSKLIVTRIIDGDNVELSTGKSVRLYGINCPEKNKPLSQESIDLTTKLALNQQIRIEYQPNYKKDRWDRVLGYVFIGDTHLNEELVKYGFCEVVIYEKRAKLIYQDELQQAEEQAKQEKLGKWK